MRIVIGVDAAGHYRTALGLAIRLAFEKPEWDLAHSVNAPYPTEVTMIPGEASLGGDFAQYLVEAGEATIDHAREYAEAQGLKVTTTMLTGDAASALVHHAEDVHAGLVCVQSDRKGRLGSLFLGSVGRGLAISSHASVLISKGPSADQPHLDAVLATDLSPYSNRAFEHFLRMGARGLRSVHVLHALHLNDEDPDFRHPEHHLPIEASLLERAREKTNEMVARLVQAGYSATCEVVNRPVNEAIEHAMASQGASLLMLGAQGHGFMERLILGSTSIYQVVAEPWSVLIIRPS